MILIPEAYVKLITDCQHSFTRRCDQSVKVWSFARWSWLCSSIRLTTFQLSGPIIWIVMHALWPILVPILLAFPQFYIFLFCSLISTTILKLPSNTMPFFGSIAPNSKSNNTYIFTIIIICFSIWREQLSSVRHIFTCSAINFFVKSMSCFCFVQLSSTTSVIGIHHFIPIRHPCASIAFPRTDGLNINISHTFVIHY